MNNKHQKFMRRKISDIKIDIDIVYRSLFENGDLDDKNFPFDETNDFLTELFIKLQQIRAYIDHEIDEKN
jgi:hypothetical protein